MWGLDDEAASDVVGTASARLLAEGVPRHERLAALRLLGMLSSSADEHGLVRRPFDDLVAEFALDADEANRALDHLVDVGIARRGIGVLVLAGVEPPAAGGLRLEDFLATAQALDEQRTVVADLPARRRPRVLGPLQSLTGAAAVIAALVAVPLLDRVTPTETVDTAAGRDAVTSTDAAPEDDDETTVAPRRSSTTDAPEVDPPLPVAVPTTTTTVVTECPTGNPLLEVLGVAEDSADGLASVEGTATNDSDAEMQLAGFTVTVAVGDQVVALPGIDRPLTIPAGETVRWTVRTPLTAVPGITADVVVDGWRWSDDAVPGTCR